MVLAKEVSLRRRYGTASQPDKEIFIRSVKGRNPRFNVIAETWYGSINKYDRLGNPEIGLVNQPLVLLEGVPKVSIIERIKDGAKKVYHLLNR